MTLRVRALSDEEREELGRMARSRSLGAGLVRRAQIVMQALEGLKAPEISARMDLCGATVRHWLKRFNARGLEGLEEDVRTGRPPTYSASSLIGVGGSSCSWFLPCPRVTRFSPRSVLRPPHHGVRGAGVPIC